MFENIEKVPSGRDAMSVRTKRLGHGQDHGHAIQERQCSVLTNQCFGKETNAELSARGTEESFLTDSDKFIVERHDWPGLDVRLLMMHDDGKSFSPTNITTDRTQVKKCGRSTLTARTQKPQGAGSIFRTIYIRD